MPLSRPAVASEGKHVVARRTSTRIPAPQRRRERRIQRYANRIHGLRSVPDRSDGPAAVVAEGHRVDPAGTVRRVESAGDWSEVTEEPDRRTVTISGSARGIPRHSSRGPPRSWSPGATTTWEAPGMKGGGVGQRHRRPKEYAAPALNTCRAGATPRAGIPESRRLAWRVRAHRPPAGPRGRRAACTSRRHRPRQSSTAQGIVAGPPTPRRSAASTGPIAG